MEKCNLWDSTLKRYASKFLLLWFFLSCIKAFPAPVSHVVLDLDETIIQRDQIFKVENGSLVPTLEAIHIEALYPDGSLQARTYYIRPGARKFLEYLVEEKQNGRIGFSILSYSHQHRLNAVTDAIRIQGEPLSSHVNVSFGSEVVTAYSRLMHSLRERESYKDLGLVVHPRARKYWERLRNGDLSVVAELVRGHSNIPTRIMMIDDKPQYLHPSQRDQVVLLNYKTHSEGFWKKYLAAAIDMLPPVEEAYEREGIVAELETENRQFEIITELLKMATEVPYPNSYRNWSRLFNVPRMLALEKAHFKYIIPDLLKEDSAQTDLLVLGRDGDLLYESLKALKGPLGIRSKISYAPISRLVTNNSSREEVLSILEKSGVSVDEIREGNRRLRIVDNGYAGTVPKAIIRALFSGEPNWQTKVRNVSAALITTPAIPNDPSQFRTLDQFLDHGAFVERAIHQERVGAENLRRIVHYWEFSRPHEHVRPYRSSNGEVILQGAHPTEQRYARLMQSHMKAYFKNPVVIEALKKRILFLRGVEGNYPNHWAIQEPGKKDLRKPFVDNQRLQQIKLRVLQRDLELRNEAREIYWNLEREFAPFLVNHIRVEHSEHLERFSYVPKFAEELEYLRTHTTQKLEPLSISKAEILRYQGLLQLSRSARGLHTKEATPKQMLNYGGDLARVTIEAQKQVNQIIKQNLNKNFSSSAELERFIFSISSSYEGTVNSRPQIFRDWAFGFEDLRQSTLNLEVDWIWFIHWLLEELRNDYDPRILAAKVHFLLSVRLHPFYDGVGKTTRDLVDFIFMRKGFMPPNWSKVSMERYFREITTLQGTYDLIVDLEVRVFFANKCMEAILGF